jgi:CheY-like chemotaxis protein
MSLQTRPEVLKGHNILVVEDETDSRDVARILLEMYGATVTLAENGQEALEVLQTVKPLFIISDLSMPIMTGWDMIEQIRKDRSFDNIPIIALTAHAMKGDREKAFAAGFHNYLTKPLQPKTFIQDLLVLISDIPEIVQALEHA